jgi:hypothetical protein
MSIRNLVIAVLKDEYGVSVETFEQIRGVLREEDSDIIDAVRETEGRVYLP